MKFVMKINDELSIAEAVTFTQLQQVAEAGYQSLLNLRLLNHWVNHLMNDEQQQAERLGLCYVNLLVNTEVINPEIAAKVLNRINRLPKPMLVCCSNATLAAAMVFIHIAVNQGKPLQQAFRRAEELGLFKNYSRPAPS